LNQTVGALLIVAAVSAFFLLSALWKIHLDGHAEVKGRLLPPEGARELGRLSRIDGELGPVPYGHHVWLAFEVGGLLVPVEPELHAEAGHFSVELGSEPREEPFSLVLVLVGPKGQRAIEYWLLEGDLGEGFPAFDSIPGATEIDRVRDIRLARAEARPASPS